MKNIPIDLTRFRPFRPLAIRSCVFRGYVDGLALVIADRSERQFTDRPLIERASTSAVSA